MYNYVCTCICINIHILGIMRFVLTRNKTNILGKILSFCSVNPEGKSNTLFRICFLFLRLIVVLNVTQRLDLLTTLSKYIHLGYKIDEAIELSTSRPAASVGLSDRVGSLSEGADADIAIIEHRETEVLFKDAAGNTRAGKQILLPVTTLRKGRRFNPMHSVHPQLFGSSHHN